MPALAHGNRATRLGLIGGFVLAALLVGVLWARSHGARAGGLLPGGLPRPISPGMESLPELPAPDPNGAAEIDELLAMAAKRGEAEAAEATAWQAGAVLRWNEIARGLVSKYNTSPVVASRVLALLSVAQHDAMIAVTRAQRLHRRAAPASADARLHALFAVPADAAYPSEHAAVAAVSAAVLSYVYSSKEQIAALEKRAIAHQESRLWAGVSRRSDVAAGDQIGRAVAERVIAHAKTDAADRAGVNWQGTIPTGKDKWASSEHPPVVPLRPKWGEVRPWLMSKPDQFRPEPPPGISSPEFAAALDELRRISRTRTAEQLRIANFWGDSPGSPTPPGHWNRVAAELLVEQHVGELGAARVLAFLNMAVMDAGIGCWDAKYHYWFLRPTMADPTITIPTGLPNFPSYPSGHSTFSGAAAEVLGYFFPAAKERVSAMAEEASVSRIYGGIHYRFDGERGLAQGRAIGKLANEREGLEAFRIQSL
jgi:membrane-associated phospholipid phosphatase